MLMHPYWRRRQHGERGAALIEFVMVIPLLFVLLIGIAELGIAMRDWLTVTSATRSGARVGTAAGQDDQADFLMLQAIESAMGVSDIDDVTSVWIFRADPDDGSPTGDRNEYSRVSSDCGWSPCPDFSGGSGSYGGAWIPSVRNVTVATGQDLDMLGVRINFDHEWLSEFLGFPTGRWKDDAVMRMEPQQFGP